MTTATAELTNPQTEVKPSPNPNADLKAKSDYSNTADTLVDRIVALIPHNPGIVEMTDPWALFKVPGFKCDDIAPSLFQASWALAAAKRKAQVQS